MTNATPIKPTNGSLKIMPLSKSDYDAWLSLWQSYLTFYESSLPLETTNATWHSLLDSNVPIYGFGAWQDDKLVGITHVVLHPNTWNSTECCYLEDLYVDQSVRGHGVGRALIEQVYEFARQQNCNRVYWTTQEGNTTARKLYDTIATQTDMVQYRKNL
ncbi:Aminoglycoside N(6')-acetyltransferase type 1 [Psychrobacter sp. SC65A.3]|uniref:GNAT family N-acetyltransferase n=1 Tax=Psychrobacter sp. SC65A.3 TaxID=2983299 RepID=UPI0021D806E5|nr:GNAT family N-acetyltransferase [Psychrobacter sp. SC65A.3]WAI88218.1 Aminoglycoside N(6')-acetyltransferase type 1 [Psychrobacter sp. SC65A.3]